MGSAATDRVASASAAASAARGYQLWRDLLFVHWEVSEEQLRPLVPAALELDAFEGRYYVGIVAFAMQGVRAHWVPERLGFRFLETNVRTYVRRGDDAGVYFLSLDAASYPAVRAARLLWGLPYYYAAMQSESSSGEYFYELTRKGPPLAHFTARWRVEAEPRSAQPGSIEHFLIERYRLYVKRRLRLLTGEVRHAPYPVQQATLVDLHQTLLDAARIPLADSTPAFVHFASGVDVEIFGLRPAKAMKRD